MRITARSLILLLPLVAIAAAAPAGPVGGVQALALRQDPSGTQSDPSANPTDPTDPGTTPTDPGTTPTDPGTTPTDPGTTPTDPGTTPTDPGTTPTTTDRPTQWFLTADNVAADNSTAHLTAAGQGAIAALGDFSASSGVRWTPELLEVGYKAAVGSDDALHTIGGGYTINTDGISVGAGIDFQDQGTSFSLNVGTNGTIVASVWGDNLTCTVDGNKAICSNA